MPLFAVIRTRGAAWQADAGLEGQPAWREHADFMDHLEAEGVVVLGGPLEGTPDVLLVMRAESAEDITRQLQADPWTSMELLRTLSIRPWSLRLGALPAHA